MDVAWTEARKRVGSPYLEAMMLGTVGVYQWFKNCVWGFANAGKWKRGLGLALPPVLLVGALRSAVLAWEETKKTDSKLEKRSN